MAFMTKSNIERSLVLLKPDSLQRGLVGEIITRFERAGLKLVGIKMLSPGEDHYYHHYETIGRLISRRGRSKFDKNLRFMLQGPVIALVLEGIEAVALVRKMVGDTEPKAAQPGTIRGDYAHMSYAHADDMGVGIPNLVHASGDAGEAVQEIAHWFSEIELFNYPSVHERFTLKGRQD